METQDLDIDNYNIYDLLNIFQLPFFFTEDNFTDAKNINSSIIDNADTLSPDICAFYKKAYTLTDCLKKHREMQKIQRGKYIANVVDDTQILDQIKEIDNYADQDAVTLLAKIVKPVHNKIEREPLSNPTHPFNPPDKTTYTNTFTNKVVEGSINSIRRVVQYKNIHLNSCFREKYYNSNPCDFKYTFPSELKNIVSIRLASIEIPNSWYLFSHIKNNNSFRIIINACQEACTFDIIVPDGNYDSETLIDYLNKTYFYQSDTESYLKYVQISINELNFKTQIKLLSNAPPNTTLTLCFTEKTTENIMDTLGWTIGFRLGKYINICDSIESEGLFDAGGDRYIYFCLNDYQYNKNESNLVYFEETSIEEDVLAKIPMINGKLCLIVNDNSTNSYTKVRRYNGPINLKKVHIRVLDKFGDIINLNNMDFSFTLELEILYERNNIV